MVHSWMLVVRMLLLLWLCLLLWVAWAWEVAQQVMMLPWLCLLLWLAWLWPLWLAWLLLVLLAWLLLAWLQVATTSAARPMVVPWHHGPMELQGQLPPLQTLLSHQWSQVWLLPLWLAWVLVLLLLTWLWVLLWLPWLFQFGLPSKVVGLLGEVANLVLV